MNGKIVIAVLVGFMMCLVSQSCKQPVEPVDTSILNGKWLVTSAERNAKETATLNKAIFVFNPDSTMQTNFTGEEVNTNYTVSGNVITQVSGDKLPFTILNLSTDSLTLQTKLMDYNFKFFLANERLDPFDEMDKDLDNLKAPTMRQEAVEIDASGNPIPHQAIDNESQE